MPEDSLDELALDGEPTVDDFIRELEEKERDLHITADLSIEIAELDLDNGQAQAFVEQDVANDSARPQANDLSGQPPAANANANVKARNFELENEIAALKVRIMELKAERAEQQEKSDRRLKDFENYKYRMDRERRASFIEQIANLGKQMLPALDNLDRALDSVPAHAEEKDPVFSQFFDGIVLVSQQVNEVFAGMGVEPIKTVGETFDPNFHEAVAVEERAGIAPNTIIEEMLRGYRIGNKVIRHSMVKVTAAPAAEAVIQPPVETSPVPTDIPAEASSDQAVIEIPHTDQETT